MARTYRRLLRSSQSAKRRLIRTYNRRYRTLNNQATFKRSGKVVRTASRRMKQASAAFLRRTR